MAGLPAPLPWEAPTREPGSPRWAEAGVPGQEPRPLQQAIAWLTVSAALCGAVGNGVFCCLLCLWVGSSPYRAYVLSLTVTDVLDLACTAGTLLEEILWGPGQEALPAAAVLEPVSAFSSTVELCVLAAMTAQCALGPLRPGARRPSAAAASALSWALALCLHAAVEACGSWARGPACVWLLRGFALFRLAAACVLGASSLALAARCLCGLRGCSLRGVPRDTCLAALSALLWGLPLVVVLCFLQQEPLSQAFHLLRLLLCVASVAHPGVYYLAGRLLGRRRPESLRRSLQRALMSAAVGGREGGGPGGPEDEHPPAPPPGLQLSA